MGRVALLFLLVAGGLIAVAVVAFVLIGRLDRAPSQSMEPTVHVGDRFAVLKFGAPEVGDIVVLHPPRGAEGGGVGQMCGGGSPPEGAMCAKPTGGKAGVTFIKRVVAAGGDEISMRGGRITRNGEPETTKGPQACEDDGCEFPKAITVPKGHLFMLGDNRGASDDSRFWGPVPEDWVIGRYWFKFG